MRIIIRLYNKSTVDYIARFIDYNNKHTQRLGNKFCHFCSKVSSFNTTVYQDRGDCYITKKTISHCSGCSSKAVLVVDSKHLVKYIIRKRL